MRFTFLYATLCLSVAGGVIASPIGRDRSDTLYPRGFELSELDSRDAASVDDVIVRKRGFLEEQVLYRRMNNNLPPPNHNPSLPPNHSPSGSRPPRLLRPLRGENERAVFQLLQLTPEELREKAINADLLASRLHEWAHDRIKIIIEELDRLASNGNDYAKDIYELYRHDHIHGATFHANRAEDLHRGVGSDTESLLHAIEDASKSANSAIISTVSAHDYYKKKLQDAS